MVKATKRYPAEAKINHKLTRPQLWCPKRWLSPSFNSTKL